MNKNILVDYLKQRILILDGAMGTMIQQLKLTEQDWRKCKFTNWKLPLQGNNDLLCLTQPEYIRNIHKEYLNAGADIIETNTFNATRISQADYGTEEFTFEINLEAAKIAREAADSFSTVNRKRFVAGSIGPTNKSLSLSPNVSDPGFRAITFDQLVLAYSEQIEGLIQGGVDILCIETIFDTLNAKAAIFAAHKVFNKLGTDIPIMLSGTITDASGRTLSGQTLEAFHISIEHANPLSIGLNCAFGAKQMIPYAQRLSETSPFFLSLHPNAGLPNQFGDYDETPADMAKSLLPLLGNGHVNIIGGCCGTTPAHIKEIANVAKDMPPRKPGKRKEISELSGLEPCTIDKSVNFISVGERTNVAGSKKFARLISERNYDEALLVARDQVIKGAQIIDVNMDDAMLDSEKCMVEFLNLLVADPEIARVPIMIDSSKFSVIEAGLKCVQGKSVVNSLSLKEGPDIFIERAKMVYLYGAAIVVMAFDEQGQAATLERRIEIFKRAYDLLTKKANIPPSNIIFDPNVLAVATGMIEHKRYGIDFIESVKWIKDNLPHAKCSGGISNISFSFRGNNTIREAMHSAFLYHAIKAGLDMGIVNSGALPTYDEIPSELLKLIEDVLLDRNEHATENLIEFAQNYKAEINQPIALKQDLWRDNSVDERLKHALKKGIVEYLEVDLKEALSKFQSALAIVEGPLMDGMNEIGDLFGSGKMFLPQVVRSARVMKTAVDILSPIIEQDKKVNAANQKSAKIILATVKGDVHDIGKNIVAVVLGCNNHTIIDLGVMVPAEDILTAAKKHQADMIGLSGLITPSLEEMTHVAKKMEEEHFKIPLLIGGATTTPVHTAVKIAPSYSGAVIHVRDSSKSVQVVNQLLQPETKAAYIESIKNSQKEFVEIYKKNSHTTKLVSYEQARKNHIQIDWQKENIVTPNNLGRFISTTQVKEIIPFINWMFFFVAWELKGPFPAILDDPQRGEEARKLFNDAQALLEKFCQDELTCQSIYGIYPANSIEDDIEVYLTKDKNESIIFHNLRSQSVKDNKEPNKCLSDFIAPKHTNKTDYIGAFAVTAGDQFQKISQEFTSQNNDYLSIMTRILADRIAEAYTELLHLKIRKEYWGFAQNENLTTEELFKEKYQSIRPAHGYPACPDHSEKEILFKLLKPEEIGLHLTQNFMMSPPASVSGLIFANPKASYFAVGKIGKDQLESYSQRKQMSIEECKKYLGDIVV